jgi:hypothetical protein
VLPDPVGGMLDPVAGSQLLRERRGLPLLRAPGADSASNQSPAVDPAPGGGGGAYPVTSSSRSSHLWLWVHGSGGGCGGMDLATSSGNTWDRARWAFFNFMKLFMEAGYLT